MKNNKGITLIALIISIILMAIIATITISTSIDSYNQMIFEGKKNELEQMQKVVNEIASDYQVFLRENSEGIKSYSIYFNDRYNIESTDDESFDKKLLNANWDKVNNLKNSKTQYINSIRTKDTAFYFTSDDIAKYFDLKGISALVVDFSTREVCSVNGISDPNGKDVYYTLSDFGGTKNISKKTEQVPSGSVIRVEKHGNGDEKHIEVDITVNQELFNRNNIEIYYTTNVNDNSIYTKIEDFRKIETENAYVFRVTVDSGKTYRFKVIDDVKNEYISDNISV